MKNCMAIDTLSRQLKATAERIGDLTTDIERFEQCDSGMVDTCVGLRMDELEHAQMLVLKLTEFITQASAETFMSNMDEGGSAFGPGELDSKVGEKTDGAEPVAEE